MKDIHYADYATKAVEILSKGAFLNTTAEGIDNTMTIAWGSIGFMWGKPIFTVMVRKSRHTFELLEKNPEFTVSIPLNDMKSALGICGSKSGRDTDKFAVAKLEKLAGQKISTPAIKGAGLHFECKVVYKQVMSDDHLQKAAADKWYADKDWHTLYYGEIVSAYLED
ncbi:flavin reductase family protein [Anaerosinus massiliensis]|uniref:flavin reductase family protein n=1 Tax=Massilibacillus massiliensis TaxID=1806837 RepID=UPI000DA61BE7|nr:flavin reductase family protein [Massilibacillus massiliensis]